MIFFSPFLMLSFYYSSFVDKRFQNHEEILSVEARWGILFFSFEGLFFGTKYLMK